jgi:hypothetical protein
MQTEFSAVAVMKTKYRQWLIIETELREAISSVTSRLGKLWAVEQAHSSQYIRRAQTVAHEPLHDITLLVGNIKLSLMLTMLYLITNGAALLFQPRKLSSRRQNRSIFFYILSLHRNPTLKEDKALKTLQLKSL